jgi:hypothetical protein
MAAPESRPVFAGLSGPLRAAGAVVLPTREALDEEGWQRALSIIEHALATRPAGVRRQIRLFLLLINLLPFLTTGRTFQRLSPERRANFLERLQRSRLVPIRRGIWGVRTLLFMGYYLQDPVRERIGYRARPGGWLAREEGSPAHGDLSGPGGSPTREAEGGTAQAPEPGEGEGAT